jgi:hypothetical protein
MVSSPHIDVPRQRPNTRQLKQGLEARLCSAVFIPTSGMLGEAFSGIPAIQVINVGSNRSKTLNRAHSH